jgi:hypothetical protein
MTFSKDAWFKKMFHFKARGSKNIVANIWKPFSYLVTFSYLEFLCSLLSGYDESKGHTRVNGFLVPYCFLIYPPKGVKEPGGHLDLI